RRRRLHAVQAANETLASVKERPRFVADGGEKPVLGLVEPRHPVRHDAVLLFVGATATPVERLDSPCFPITHRIPVQILVWPPLLFGSPAGVAPEERDVVHA